MKSAHTTCIRTMRREVGDTTNGVALNFYIWAEHLPNERLESAEPDDEELVVRCGTRGSRDIRQAPWSTSKGPATHY